MKKIVFVFTLFTAMTLTVIGQKPLMYTEVIQADSISKLELYNRAKSWFSTTYNSANNVIQNDNKEDGEIIGKANIIYNPKVFSGSEQTKGSIKYTIKIYVKEGRCKYEITDFIHDPFGNQYGKSSMGLITTDKECPNPKPFAKGWSNNVWEDIKNQIDENITKLVNSLKESLSKKSESKKDDW